VRITHIPSGVVVESQEDRSQVKNREIALKKLKKILTDQNVKDTFERMLKTRKSQVGQANRNEKIRTFNFKDDRVTDHRLSALGACLDEKVDSQYDLDGFFKNPRRLDVFIENLKKVERQQEIERIFSSL
jgi:peptide chain release factor 1